MNYEFQRRLVIRLQIPIRYILLTFTVKKKIIDIFLIYYI